MWQDRWRIQTTYLQCCARSPRVRKSRCNGLVLLSRCFRVLPYLICGGNPDGHGKTPMRQSVGLEHLLFSRPFPLTVNFGKPRHARGFFSRLGQTRAPLCGQSLFALRTLLTTPACARSEAMSAPVPDQKRKDD